MASDRKIKVFIVDDSYFFVKALERGLSEDPAIEIIGTSQNPVEAMEKIKELRPDVVTLDVEMPMMSGIEFLKKLIPVHPVPVIVVSSLPLRVLDALDAGAVDFVRKPDIQSSKDYKGFMGEMIIKVKIASVAKVRNQLPLRAAAPAEQPKTLPFTVPSAAARQTVIAIGASTGGTEAILAVVRDLPPTTPGIVVVQHMPPVFTNMYAERLNRLCPMKVVEAADRERVVPGKIIIGAGEFHLRLCKDAAGYYVTSQPGPKVSGHCPSVDVLFDSVAAAAGRFAMGIILTGMGSDGANGLLKMRQAGAYTVGQDKETCVVYGMPQAAYSIGAVQSQLPLNRMGGDIIRYLNTRR